MPQIQTLPTGTILNGRFKIRRLLSENPWGAIYLVDDVKITEKPWVVKEFFPPNLPEKERLAMEDEFYRKVDSVKLLSHPNLIRVLDSFPENGRLYLVLEYIEGLSMDAISRLSPNLLPEKNVLEWGIQLCNFLEFLHNLPKPFFVKDLNPRNILIDRDGQVKVDLNLMDQASPCVAPEVAKSKVGSVTGDIYSLCACLYILLARQTPKPPATPLKELNPQVSNALHDVIMQNLSLEPEKRLQAVSDLKTQFLRILNPPPPPPPPKPGILEIVFARVAKGLSFFVNAAIWIYERPYYFILLGLLFAAVWFTFKPFALPPFEKKGPLIYVSCYKKVEVVDPVSFKVLATLPEFQADFSTYSPKTQEVWLASHKGDVLVINPQTNTVEKQANLKQGIGGLALGEGGAFYVSLDKDNTLAVIGPSGLPTSEIPVGRNPGDVVYDAPLREVFVANLGSTSITVVDAEHLLVQNTLTLDASPSHIAETEDGRNLVVVYNSLSRMDLFSAQNNSIEASVNLSFPGPYALGVFKDEVIVAAHDGNQILFYQIPALKAIARNPLDKPNDAAFSPDGRILYVSNEAGYLFSLNPQTGAVLESRYIGRDPGNLLPIP
jgi:DNA-binding beta-propeller fold protein YncE